MRNTISCAFETFLIEVTDHDWKADDWVLVKDDDFEPVACTVDNFVQNQKLEKQQIIQKEEENDG